MKINEAQAQKFEMNGFKWAVEDEAGRITTDTVHANLIESVVPTREGFVVVYTDDSFLTCTACRLNHIEWTDDYGKWNFVYPQRLEDISRKNVINSLSFRKVLDKFGTYGIVWRKGKQVMVHVIIQVEGGLVQTVYTDKPDEVDVEVLDLDVSGIAMSKEEIEHNKVDKERAVKISLDKKWKAVY